MPNALAFVVLLSLATATVAQHAGGHLPAGGAATSEAMGPFSVRVFGAFRNFMQKQDYSATVALPEVRANGTTEAVGALSGLRGEITIVDSVPIVSYGGCPTCTLKHGETAALLGVAKVGSWVEGSVFPADLAGKERDDFILAEARKVGMDGTQPFPIRLTGPLVKVEMHVIEGPNAGFTGHGSKVHMAKQDNYRHAEIDGLVIAFFAPPGLQGALTHPGEPFHYHWVAKDRRLTAHLDAFSVKAGTRLWLPKP